MLVAPSRPGVTDADANTASNATTDRHSDANADHYRHCQPYRYPRLATMSESDVRTLPAPAPGGSPGIARGIRGAAISHPTERAPRD